jgi:hypothetical protein
MEANTRMNTKLKTAAELIANNIREHAEYFGDANEPYCWGLTVADVAKDVFEPLKDKHPGKEEWARDAMRAGLRSEHQF